MTGWTHIRMLDGTVRGPLTDAVRPYPEQIRYALNRLDGSSRWGYSLWRAPDGADLLDDLPDSEEYLQCAGSAEAMTVEVRILDEDGTAHQYTVGRPDCDSTGAPTETVRWAGGKHSTAVYPHELFTADEAADIVYGYFLTDAVPERYALRELDLTWPPPSEAEESKAGRIAVEIVRVDAHPGDQDGLTKSVEGPDHLLLSDLLSDVLEPYLDAAPRTMWVCRAASGGRWRDVAEVITYGPPERIGTRLLVPDESLRSFLGPSESTLHVSCLARSPERGGGPSRGLLSRRLVFGDDTDHEQEWLPGDAQPALAAFIDFMDERHGDDNTAFSIEDEENGEALGLMLEHGVAARARTGEGTEHGYRFVTDDGDYRALVNTFVRGGYAGLESDGPWWPDVPALVRAGLRAVFDDSALARTDPPELRRRLVLITAVGGGDAVTVGGVTRLGYSGPDGDVVAWFTADGRALLVTHDRTSALAAVADRAALYDGVASDLLALVRTVPAPGATIPHPDGGTLPAATGVFHLSGTWAVADGLVARLQEEGLGLDDTGVGRLLGVFLEPEDLTPAAVAHAGTWWSADDVARGFADADLGDAFDLTGALARAGLAERWYRWCDTGRDWSAEATGVYEQDSLRTERGGFAPLSVDEFMGAYRDAGGEVSRGSARFDDRRHRSFTVDVADGGTVVRLEVRLGRGLNSEECALSILVGGVPQGPPELLHSVAYAIVESRGQQVPGDAPYPRPIISSRSHLEVSAREIVAMMADVAKGWTGQP